MDQLGVCADGNLRSARKLRRVVFNGRQQGVLGEYFVSRDEVFSSTVARGAGIRARSRPQCAEGRWGRESLAI